MSGVLSFLHGKLPQPQIDQVDSFHASVVHYLRSVSSSSASDGGGEAMDILKLKMEAVKTMILHQS